MAKMEDIPSFGVLQGVRVLHSTLSVAGPFCAEIMADHGADVIWLENSRAFDVARLGGGMNAESERRNMRTLSLNVPSPEGKEIFEKLIAETDIFIEASKPGQWTRWGFSDEELWSINEKLVIVHISGFGQTGDPFYCERGSYDPIAQAFSGHLYANSIEGKTVPALFAVADYLTALTASTLSLASYIKAQRTGVGESIDVAQYEVLMRMTQHNAMTDWNGLATFNRDNRASNGNSAGFNAYMCKDGKEVYTVVVGVGSTKALLEILGIDENEEPFSPGQPQYIVGTPAGDIVEQKLIEFCAMHDAAEVDKILGEAKVPCSLVNQFSDIPGHSHVQARESLVTWPSEVLEKDVIGPCVVPKLKNNPGQVWRGCPTIGQDNEDILAELGIDSPEVIADLYEKRVITKAK